MPVAQATLPFVCKWASATDIVTRSNWPKRICQAFLTPSQPTTTVVLSGPMTFFFGSAYLQFHVNRINRWKKTGTPI